jgi:membrane-associated protease RseP (regulator of RpoE activity)
MHTKKPMGIIGVTLGTVVANRRVGPFAAVPRAFDDFGRAISTTLVGLGDVFSFHGLQSFAHSVVTAGNSHTTHAVDGHSSASGSGTNNGPALTSVVGVIQIGSQAAGKGQLSELLDILALVNISVGLLNLFPMLPLDGGHVAIAVYERIRSRRGRHYHADITKLMPVAYVFLAFVVLLGLGAIYANIVQPVHLPGG